MIKNLIFNKIKKNGNIHILGRGPSLKFFQSSKSKITLGINDAHSDDKTLKANVSLTFFESIKCTHLRRTFNNCTASLGNIGTFSSAPRIPHLL